MSRISDFKSSAFDFMKQATSKSTGTGVLDAGIAREVGYKFSLDDGREVALVSVSATALASGVLVQQVAEVTAHQTLAMTVPTAYPASIGENQVYVTNGATVLNVNQYQGGYAVIDSGTGIGQSFRIASHAPAANAGSFVVTFEETISVALDATSTISLIANPYSRVIINPTTATGAPVGVTVYPLAASVINTYNGTTGALATVGTDQYGFIGTHGAFACLIDNTVTGVGYPLGRSAATPGAVGVATLTTSSAVGAALQTLTSAEVGLIRLDL